MKPVLAGRHPYPPQRDSLEGRLVAVGRHRRDGIDNVESLDHDAEHGVLAV